MGFKCKVNLVVGSVLLISIALVITYSILLKRKDDYNTKLITVLKERDTAMVQDVFSFEFERAFVLNDCYISGEGFAKKYNLDISIDEMKTGVSENIQRIVFVDESGDFVYEFQCDNTEMILLESGMIISPETTIERESSIQDEVLTLSFQSFEYYDSE